MARALERFLGLVIAVALAAFGMALAAQPAHADATKIASFEVEGVTPPVAGKAPSWGFSVPTGQGYAKESDGPSAWIENSSKPSGWTDVLGGTRYESSSTVPLTSFKSGRWYTFVAYLVDYSTHYAAENTPATMNGVSCSMGVRDQSIGAYVWRTFYCESGTVIDVNSFPDPVFRSYVREKFDIGTSKDKWRGRGNDILSSDEVKEATRIDISDSSALTSLEGIALLTNLGSLDCSYTGITSLDVSNNAALAVLWCNDTGISGKLDVSNNPALKQLYCYDTGIDSLDVSSNPALESLICYGTNIASLDVSGNPVLEKLDCSNTDIASLDLSNNPALEELCCDTCPNLESVFLGRNASTLTLFDKDDGVTVIEGPLGLEAGKVKLASSSLIYTGMALRPAVTVTGYAGKSLAAGTDYTVSYKSNKAVGTATVTVTGTGAYTGSVKKTFTIVPAAPKATTPKAGKKALTAKWKKAAGAAGYQVSYSTSKKFSKKSTKTAKVKGAKATSKKLTKLKGGKRYYVKVRAYKVVNGKTYYSAWSAVKNAKVKK